MAPTTPRLDGSAELMADISGRAGQAGTASETHDLCAGALRLGATGIALTVSTRDGELVVATSGRRKRLGRKPESADGIRASAMLLSLPPHSRVLLTADSRSDLVASFDLAADLGLLSRLRLAGSDEEDLAAIVREHPAARVALNVDPQSMRRVEPLAARLRRASIEAVSAPSQSWTAGHVAMFHRFLRTCIATGASQPHEAVRVLGAGVDVVTGPFPECLYDAAREVG